MTKPDWIGRSWKYDIESYERLRGFLAKVSSPGTREWVARRLAEKRADMLQRYGAAACRGL